MGRLADYQKEFIEFLVESEAVLFGSFILKSGREAPYYINTGKFDTGEKIGRLGAFYAAHIKSVLKDAPTVIFGPAYKGIPLAVATSEALSRNHKLNCFYSFDRKEVKDHGDGGIFVGHAPVAGDRLVIVEDVVAAGTTLRKVVPTLSQLSGVTLAGVVIAVDRCEVGTTSESAVNEVRRTLGVSVYPIVTIHQVIEYLSSDEAKGRKLTGEMLERIQAYRAVYGAHE